MKGLSWLQRAYLVVAVIFVSGLLSLIFLTITGGWFPLISKPFLTSLEHKADSVYTYNSKKDLNEFSLPPSSDFLVLMNKVVVNFRATRTHPRTLGAFEFYINTDSKDAAIEVKNRESELLDIIQRGLEALSYRQIQGVDGKNRVKFIIRSQLNRVLQQGRVQRVYFKTFIVKQ